MKVIIIGCVAGGATAAARIRRLSEAAEIIAFERTGYISYANCGLPYYIGKEIEDQNKLTLQTPEEFWKRYQIKAFVLHEVVGIDSKAKTVTVHDLMNDCFFEESYDKLLLAPGAKPFDSLKKKPESNKIFSLRTIEDTLKIQQYISKHKPKTALIAGAGYIGLEMAENLASLGIKVALAARSNQVLKTLDYDMACQVHTYLSKIGIDLMLNTKVAELEEENDLIIAKTEEGKLLRSDIVILATGIIPESDLAKNAGLQLGNRGAIVVNGHMETSEADIYAVGDAVSVKHFVSGEETLISLAGPANKQGRIAADNICGIPSVYKGSQGSTVLKLNEMTIATTGLNTKACKDAGLSYDRIVLVSPSHATYYPNAKNMVIKVLFDPQSGRILGAQIVGYGGVDKRIDAFATAIRANMSAEELKELEFAYAPPYSSAKDPVNMAGFIIENVVKGRVKQFHWDDVARLHQENKGIMLDVRTKAEYDRGHIEKTIHIPLDLLREHLSEFPKELPIYVNCQSGMRSYIACRILSQNGFDCYNLSGGFSFYNMVVSNAGITSAGVLPCGKETK